MTVELGLNCCLESVVLKAITHLSPIEVPLRIDTLLPIQQSFPIAIGEVLGFSYSKPNAGYCLSVISRLFSAV